ncbi:hypothetical protein HXX76_016234 [Chlamydomonas incerta]|uniref:Uncharacterized protein n=1 Tax=Chlamydomonas incerta TaxID=51695 RepID=A0A835VQW2_CHLIN|nr:hypothetical protein HXX76_016234 [Chlamydomonas incerta]|eukprot:KAG2422171.1 hypothetical protein HXX76_016234 [Chlamydomonas incerta]
MGSDMATSGGSPAVAQVPAGSAAHALADASTGGSQAGGIAAELGAGVSWGAGLLARGAGRETNPSAAASGGGSRGDGGAERVSAAAAAG